MANVTTLASLLAIAVLVGAGSGLGLGYVGLNPQANDLQKQVDATRNSLSELQKRLSTSEDATSKLQERLDKSQNQLTQLQNQLTSVQNLVITLQQERTSLQDQLVTANKERMQSDEMIAQLKGRISIMTTEIVSLQKSIDSLNNQIVALQVENVRLRSTTPQPLVQAFYKGSPAPVSVAVDIKGTVYWTNWDLGQLLSMPKGSNLPTVILTGLDHPSGLTIDASGNIYYSEYLRKTVSVLPSGGSPTLLFIAQNYPPFLSADQNGNIFYVEGETCNGSGANNIVKFDRSSKALTTILKGSGSNPWFGSAYFTPSGDLYYTACGAGTVERLLRGSSSPEVLIRGLQWPNGIAVNAQGDVFYTEYSKGVSLLPKGSNTPLTIATAGGTHYMLALDAESNVYYTDNLGGTIWKISRSASQPVQPPIVVPGFGPAQALVTGQAQPVGMTVDNTGTLYWVNWGSGQLLALRKSSPSPTVILGGLGYPQDVKADTAGNLYFSEYARGTISMLPAGSDKAVALISGQSFPNYLSVDANGNVYFITGETCGDKIVRFDQASKSLAVLITAPGPRDTGRGFGGLFIHSSGDLYYTTCRRGTIERLPAGSSNPEILKTGLDAPNGIAVDGSRNIFYTDYYKGVYLLPKGSSEPVLLTTAGSSHNLLTLDKDGNLYYNDNIGGIIWKIPKT